MEYKNCGRKIELVGRTNEEIPSNSLISSMHRDNLKGHRCEFENGLNSNSSVTSLVKERFAALETKPNVAILYDEYSNTANIKIQLEYGTSSSDISSESAVGLTASPQFCWKHKEDPLTPQNVEENPPISASHLCDEAKKKISLPIDNVKGNITSPASDSTISGICSKPCTYVVKKLRNMPKLHRAVWRGEMNKIQSICNGIRKAVINARDEKQRTALHIACDKGAHQIIHYLCTSSKSIINVNLKDCKGNTPIHKVIESGSCGNSLQFLLDCDADISLENNVGRTPLHVASQCCNVEAALFLLFKGTPVNAKDKTGRTPLHLAAINDNEAMITALIMHGADVRIKDNFGRTPLMLSGRHTNQFIRDLSAEQDPDNTLPTEKEYICPNVKNVIPGLNSKENTDLLVPSKGEEKRSDDEISDTSSDMEHGRRSEKNRILERNSSKYLSELFKDEATCVWFVFSDECVTTKNRDANFVPREGKNPVPQIKSREDTIQSFSCTKKDNFCNTYDMASLQATTEKNSPRGLNQITSHNQANNTNIRSFRASCDIDGRFPLNISNTFIDEVKYPNSMPSDSSQQELFKNSISRTSLDVFCSQSGSGVMEIDKNSLWMNSAAISTFKRSSVTSFQSFSGSSVEQNFCSDGIKVTQEEETLKEKSSTAKNDSSDTKKRKLHKPDSEQLKNVNEVCQQEVKDVSLIEVEHQNIQTLELEPESQKVTDDYTTEESPKVREKLHQDQEFHDVKECKQVKEKLLHRLDYLERSLEEKNQEIQKVCASYEKKITELEEKIEKERETWTVQKAQQEELLMELQDKVSKSSEENRLLLIELDSAIVTKEKSHEAEEELQQQLASIFKTKHEQEEMLKEVQQLKIDANESKQTLLRQLNDVMKCKKEQSEQLEKAALEKEEILQELHDANKVNQELLQKLKETNTAKERQLCTVDDHLEKNLGEKNEGPQKDDSLLKDIDALKKELERERERGINEQKKQEEGLKVLQEKLSLCEEERRFLLLELEDATVARKTASKFYETTEVNEEIEQQLVNTIKEKLEQEQLLNSITLSKERIAKQLKDVEEAKQDLVQQLNDISKCKQEQCELLESTKKAGEELNQKLLDANKANQDLKMKLEDACNVNEEQRHALDNLKKSLELKDQESQMSHVLFERKMEDLIKQHEREKEMMMIQEMKQEELMMELQEKYTKIQEENKYQFHDIAVRNEKLLSRLDEVTEVKEELQQELVEISKIKHEQQQTLKTITLNNDKLLQQLKEADEAKMALLQQLEEANRSKKEYVKSAEKAGEELLLKLQDTDKVNQELLLDLADANSAKEEQLHKVEYLEKSLETKNQEYDSVVAKLSSRIEIINDELLEVMKTTENYDKDIQTAKAHWAKEKKELEQNNCQLKLSLEQEVQQREDIHQKATDLQLELNKMIDLIRRKERELMEAAERENSHVRFLESRIVMLEHALKSAQSLADDRGNEVNILHTRCSEMENILCMMDRRLQNAKESEGKVDKSEGQLEKSNNVQILQLEGQLVPKELQQKLKECKDLFIVTEEWKKEVSVSIAYQVKELKERLFASEERERELRMMKSNAASQVELGMSLTKPRMLEYAGCNVCSVKIKSLEHTIAVLKRKSEYARTTTKLLEENCEHHRSEATRLQYEIDNLRRVTEEVTTMRDQREKDAMETRRLMEEQLKSKDETIASFMKMSKHRHGH